MTLGTRPSSPALSVVIVTYNSSGVILNALRQITKHLPDAEIVVVDNGSTDGTAQYVRDWGGAVLTEGHGNVGFGAGVNLGVRASSGKLLLILNPDASVERVDGHEIEALAAAVRVGIRACVIRDVRTETPGLETYWGWPLELAWAITQWLILPRELSAPRPKLLRLSSRTWVGGAAFMVRRDEFDAIGGFDEAYFLYFEDEDLSERYRAAGLPISATNAVTVSHIGQHSSSDGGEAIQAFALASLVERASRQNPRAAARAANASVVALGLVQGLARIGERVPKIGGRAQRKRRSAARIRANLGVLARSPPTASAYSKALPALERALARHERS